MTIDSLTLTTCSADEVGELLSWIRQLADCEGRPEAVTITPERLKALIRTEQFSALFLKVGDQTIGYAVTFPQHSTYSGETSLYLEDIYIGPSHRGHGFGAKAMRLLASKAASINATTLSWSVLRTNRSAIEFYEKLGASPVLAWGHYAIPTRRLLEPS